VNRFTEYIVGSWQFELLLDPNVKAAVKEFFRANLR
jgi:hypothetical protein